VLDRFFQRQIEECRELARHAVDEKDQAFWQQAAARWEEQLREVQQIHPLLKHDRNIGTDDQGSVFAGFTASGEMALRKFVKN
jgi:ferritin